MIVIAHHHARFSLLQVMAPLCVLALVALLYLREWESLKAFNLAVDHHAQLFQDFLGHYYPMAQTIATASAHVPGYFYSAFFAILLIPLGALEPTHALWAWGGIQAALLMALFVLPLVKFLRLGPGWLALYTAVFATSFPLLHNTKWGQVSVLLVLCVVGAFHAYESRRPMLAGFLLGLATVIKYYPAVFLLYFLFRRDGRVCGSALVSIVVLYVVIPVAVMGAGPWLAFEAVPLPGAEVSAWLAREPNSQYVGHVVARWLAHTSWQPGPQLAAALHGFGALVFFGNLALLAWLQRQDRPDQAVLALALLFLSLPFVLRTSWPHYFSYLPFCQCVILQRCLAGGRSGLAVLPVLSIACSSFFVFDWFRGWQAYNAWGMLFVANLLLLVCVYLMLAGRPRIEADAH